MKPEQYVLFEQGTIQTPIVTFIHPKTDIKIDLAGISPIGTATYYELMQGALVVHDYVLSERFKPEQGSNIVCEIEERFARFYQRVARATSLKSDRRILSICEAIDSECAPGNWIAADLPSTVLARKSGILDHIQLRLLNRQLRKDEQSHKLTSEYVDALLTSGQYIDDCDHPLQRERESYVMHCLDDSIKRHNPTSIAILYSINHLPSLEETLHLKGYERDSIEHFNVMDDT